MKQILKPFIFILAAQLSFTDLAQANILPKFSHWLSTSQQEDLKDNNLDTESGDEIYSDEEDAKIKRSEVLPLMSDSKQKLNPQAIVLSNNNFVVAASDYNQTVFLQVFQSSGKAISPLINYKVKKRILWVKILDLSPQFNLFFLDKVNSTDVQLHSQTFDYYGNSLGDFINIKYFKKDVQLDVAEFINKNFILS